MPRLAAVVLAAAALAGVANARPRPDRPAPERPWAAAATLGPAFGLFYATHGRLGLQAGRRLFRRLELDLELRLGVGAALFGAEPALRVGVRFALGRRAQLALVARGGYASYRLAEPNRTRWVGTAVVGFATEVRLDLGPVWELRLLPAACAAYLTSPLWGLALEPSVGVARRF